MGAIPVSTPPFLLPFTDKSLNDWTDAQIDLFAMVQLAIGDYKEKSAEETETLEAVQSIEDTMASGGDWLSELRKFTGEGEEYIEAVASEEDYVDKVAQDLQEELDRLNKGL